MGRSNHTLLTDTKSLIGQARKRTRVHELDNNRLILTGAKKSSCIPTRDRSDRAHCVFDHLGMLVPGAAVNNAAQRLYPPSQMTGSGVAFDSAFDETDKRQAPFRNAGINLGFGAARSQADDLANSYPQSCGPYESRCILGAASAKELRNRIERRTKVQMSAEEAALEGRANNMLDAYEGR